MYKLIIVEDEHLIRKWLSLAVDYAMLGIEVIGLASHGQEGMALIRKLEPDIVLTDITMPIMDAFMMFEVTADIAYEKIILSGYNDFDNAKRAMKFGVCDFISKPIDAKELETCLQTVVERLNVKSVAASPDYQRFLQEFNTIHSQNKIIQQLLGWVQEHYQEHFTIAELAKEFGYSESYVYRLVKDNLAITLNEYILQYRLKQAIEMMYRYPEMKIYEIAGKVGISDYKYFGKLFKNYFGVSPTEFKETGQIEKIDRRS
ncbi:DNA-binding response regulator [Streptococcus cuniculi]|uniref:DNA-binding response regulator n=1 Tax=Streptococcus cuniculi TaxID=1432788 RepID=A0A1Q8E8S6_9STRE|nr:helix-turn-helix domain-containing protein [Streptococcus cuniculi]OLF48194.1 DNA-binding response regulator [Streptococcus cuniculi]